MPQLCSFYGIIIFMFSIASEHEPPHIHAYYAEYEASFEIRSGKITTKKFPRKATLLVREWIEENRDELLEIWETQDLSRKLPPLE